MSVSDNGRQYELMTTNYFKVSLKGACNMPIIACAQMTFYRVNEYFMFRRNDVAMCIDGDHFYPT